MKLEFINDSLMVLEFTPDGFDSYMATLSVELNKRIATSEKNIFDTRPIPLEDGGEFLILERYVLDDGVTTTVVQRGEKKIIIWIDQDLMRWSMSQ